LSLMRLRSSNDSKSRRPTSASTSSKRERNKSPRRYGVRRRPSSSHQNAGWSCRHGLMSAMLEPCRVPSWPVRNDGLRLLAEVGDRSREMAARCAPHPPSVRFAVSPWADPLGWTISPPLATKERLVDESEELAEPIAANAPLSVLATKRAVVRLVAERPLSEAFEVGKRIREPAHLCDATEEGPGAFPDRRSPTYGTGR
jgi:hypothetical protein